MVCTIVCIYKASYWEKKKIVNLSKSVYIRCFYGMVIFPKAGKMFEHLVISLHTFNKTVMLQSINRGVSHASTF